MPLYEFECTQCHEPFEELVRASQTISEVTCPNCGSRKVKKKLSTFAAKVTASGGGVAAAPVCAPGGT